MDFAAARDRLVAQLQQQIRDERVIRAMARVPLRCFRSTDAETAVAE